MPSTPPSTVDSSTPAPVAPTATPAPSGAEAPAATAAPMGQIPASLYGTYKGTLPCASCPGIDMTVVLNKDNTFTVTTVYQGVKDDDARDTDSGMIVWNKEKSMITLTEKDDDGDGDDDMDDTRRYFVGDGYIQLLGADGKKVTGATEAFYILKKQ